MSWESPLKGYENADSLPTTINSDGKSLYNPPGPKSAAYDEFPKPIDSSNNGFDFHSERFLVLCHGLVLIFGTIVYYIPDNQNETKFARELHERVRREFPEVRIYSGYSLLSVIL